MSFLCSYVGFDKNNEPIIDTEVDGTISRQPLLGKAFSWTLDRSLRYCTGWVDITKHQAHVCPDQATVEGKYEQCIACRNRTGFNPAFYYAQTVSEQQQIVNQQPHFLYLAYFSPELVKVGISQKARGTRRLLEQGARLALKLETFPNAEIARQYEARIAALDGIVEHVVTRKKLELLEKAFDEKLASTTLNRLLDNISSSLNISFPNSQIIETSPHYRDEGLSLANTVILENPTGFTGSVKAVIGSLAVVEYSERLLVYNLKSLIGYRATIAKDPIDLELPSEQMTLF